MDEKNLKKEKEQKEMNDYQETDDSGIKQLVKEVADHNRKIDDAYDLKLKMLEEKKKPAYEAGKEDNALRISLLKEKINEIKILVSDARKKGKDPLLAGIILKNAGAKIKMAEVTCEEHDFHEVENILKQARIELDEALKEEEVNVKQEVLQKLREKALREKNMSELSKT